MTVMTADPTDVSDRLARVRERVAAAAARAGRDAADVRLIVVTKDVSADRIRLAIDAGASDLGENRAQELDTKIGALADQKPRWHFIGTLQRNKVRLVAGRVALVHSLDSVALGRAVAARAVAAGGAQDVLLEVNVAGEATKHGLPPEQTADVAGELARMSGLRVCGLMTVAPGDDPTSARAAFARLRDLRDELRTQQAGVDELSMGMSGDFEAAIEEGATMVRVGTAVFGARP